MPVKEPLALDDMQAIRYTEYAGTPQFPAVRRFGVTFHTTSKQHNGEGRLAVLFCFPESKARGAMRRGLSLIRYYKISFHSRK